MSDTTIQLPPPSGSLSLIVGDNLYIVAKKDMVFCCDIGANFSPDISSMTFDKDTTNGPYQAVTAGSGNYNADDKGKPCDCSDHKEAKGHKPTGTPNPTATAKGVQISNPPAKKHHHK
jgi:hypothetical protein